ncbi:MAG: hypothetical protein AMXMBFR33_69160 [Candidatus Xenobia bacterium]
MDVGYSQTMNVNRADLQSYAQRTAAYIRNLAVDPKTSQFTRDCAEQRRLPEVETFLGQLDKTPGADSEALIRASRERGGTPGRQALWTTGLVVGGLVAAGAIVAPLLGAPLLLTAPAALAGGYLAGRSVQGLKQTERELTFQQGVKAFSEDAASGKPVGLLSGWRASGGGDADWDSNLANPANPLSPLSPANPASPLNPMNL